MAKTSEGLEVLWQRQGSKMVIQVNKKDIVNPLVPSRYLPPGYELDNRFSYTLTITPGFVYIWVTIKSWADNVRVMW